MGFIAFIQDVHTCKTSTEVTSPLGSTARACRFESCCPHQIIKAPRKGVLLLFGKKDRARTHLNASVRWTLAATSSKTGGYIYFLSPLRGKKMQIESCCPFSPKEKIQASPVARFLRRRKYRRVLLPAFSHENQSAHFPIPTSHPAAS